MADRRREILTEVLVAASTSARPAGIAWINLQNFKPLNAVLGHERCDQHLARVQQTLGELGRAWRTGGDELAAIVVGDLATVAPLIEAWAAALTERVAATEGWTFRYPEGGPVRTVIWRSFDVVCTPRCGLARLAPAGDPEEALAAARAQCERLRPSTYQPWHNERILAARGCPACDAADPAILEQDLDWSRERCAACGAHYERTDEIVATPPAYRAGKRDKKQP